MTKNAAPHHPKHPRAHHAAWMQAGLINLAMWLCACGDGGVGDVMVMDGGESDSQLSDGSANTDAFADVGPLVDANQGEIDGSARPDARLPNDAGPSTDASPTSGCGAPAESGFGCTEVEFEGATRTWCMNIPEGYDPTRTYHLMLGLHGCGGNASNVHRHRANMEAHGAGDFLFAYPQATASCWDYGRGNDTRFIQHVIDAIEQTYCVRTGDVFVHGMSSGGSMSSVLAGGGMVRAFASVSAGGGGGPVPAWYYGGRTDSYYSTIVSGKDTRVRGNGCSTTSTPIEGTPCVRYDDCEHAVVYCEDDRGHVWPAEEWAQEGMIEFFRAVP
ncbi:MAG: hypothetical protein ACI9KE_005085 [Polyangiales bacterium]|jgi:hypothetical protein